MAYVCPVCAVEYALPNVCGVCGFTQAPALFMSKDDARKWITSILEPYRNLWLQNHECELSEHTMSNVTLKIKPTIHVPANTVNLLYAIKTNQSAGRRWISSEDEYSSMFSVPFETYINDGCILHEIRKADHEDAYYVSIAVCFNENGYEKYAPILSKVIISRPLFVDLRWNIEPYGLNKYKLCVHLKTNRPVGMTVPLVLCVCRKGTYITSPNDSGAIPVKFIQEELIKTPVSEFINNEIKIPSKVEGKALSEWEPHLFFEKDIAGTINRV